MPSAEFGDCDRACEDYMAESSAEAVVQNGLGDAIWRSRAELSGEKWEALVFALMGLNVLALSEIEEGSTEEGQDEETQSKRNSKLFTPTLDQLLEFERGMNSG